MFAFDAEMFVLKTFSGLAPHPVGVGPVVDLSPSRGHITVPCPTTELP